MDEKEKALKELLEILVEHPDLAERITITIKPNRIRATRPPRITSNP